MLKQQRFVTRLKNAFDTDGLSLRKLTILSTDGLNVSTNLDSDSKDTGSSGLLAYKYPTLSYIFSVSYLYFPALKHSYLTFLIVDRVMVRAL